MIRRIALAAALLVPASYVAGGAHGSIRPALLTVGPERAIVLSPHPDDATLAAGGLIQRIIREGGSVDVVQVTDGDAFPRGVVAVKPGLRPTVASYRWYGSLREQEALRAMRSLGVSRSGLRLLGFPDEGLCVIASTDQTRSAFTSPYTERASPPVSEQVIPGTTFRHEDLVREVSSLIERIRPTLVVLPHSGDDHPDHCATHALVHRALAQAVGPGDHPPRVLHYVIHYPEWPSPSAAGRLDPPGNLRAVEWTWLSLPLTAVEQATKRRALDAYRSQMLVMADFVKSFERPNELFIEGEPASPVPCWCDGENISERASKGFSGQ